MMKTNLQDVHPYSRCVQLVLSVLSLRALAFAPSALGGQFPLRDLLSGAGGRLVDVKPGEMQGRHASAA